VQPAAERDPLGQFGRHSYLYRVLPGLAAVGYLYRVLPGLAAVGYLYRVLPGLPAVGRVPGG
jgi:hypothetical protein